MKLSKAENEIIRKNWGHKSYAEIGKLVGRTADNVRKLGRHRGYPATKFSLKKKTVSTEFEIKRDIVLQQLKSENKRAQEKYKLVAQELKEAKAMNGIFDVLRSAKILQIKSVRSGLIKEATAVALLSDTHLAETVHIENVNGKNQYDRKIAKARIEMFFVNLVKLINIFSKESQINNLVLALLGDFINGQLREEAMENNSIQPMDEYLEAKSILSAGIRYLIDNTDLNIVIPCHSGNHARITKKINVSTEASNSLEYVLYRSLADDFKHIERLTFQVPRSYHSFVDVGGVTIRFHHGHYMKYLGGVGGIYISVNKAIAQWNKVKRADLDVFAHFHQLRDGGNFVCNGSVIGWNEYANSIKADFEKPQQAFFLIDHRRKQKTVMAPIFLQK